MKKIIRRIQRLMKVMFSLSLLQLLYISFCLQPESFDADFAYRVLTPVYRVPEMLEHAAMTALLALICGYILEYAVRKRHNN